MCVRLCEISDYNVCETAVCECMCVYLYVSLSQCACIWVCVSLCMSTCLHVSVHVCIGVYVVSDTDVEDNIKNNLRIKHDAPSRDRLMA